MTRRQIATLILAGALAAGLAYFFSDLIERLIVIPAAYLWWVLGLIYRALPQQAYWILLLTALVFLFASSFYFGRRDARLRRERSSPPQGPVESLVQWIEQREKGIYFKWQLARLLSEIAAEILDHQDRRISGRDLNGHGWDPPERVRRYLEAGLKTTFADYPSRGLFTPPPKTPFDIDLDPVIEFLESELEGKHDR